MSDLLWFRSLHRLNLNHLLTFLAVAETRSFRAAAALIHISQSALSVQVRQLETDLGIPLFHRTTRAVQLTKEGKRLYAVGKRLSTEILLVAQDLKAEAALQRGIVSVVVYPSLANMLLPKVMSAFFALYPGIELKLFDADSVRARQLLRDGEVDVGVLSRTEHLSNMQFVPLFEDEYFVVVPAEGHALSSRSFATPQDVAAYPLFITPRDSDLRDSVDTFFRENGIIPPTPAQELVGTHPMLAMVGFGFGICVLPRMSLDGVERFRCRALPLMPFVARTIGIVLPQGRSETPTLRAFREFLEANALRLSKEAITH